VAEINRYPPKGWAEGIPCILHISFVVGLSALVVAKEKYLVPKQHAVSQGFGCTKGVLFENEKYFYYEYPVEADLIGICLEAE